MRIPENFGTAEYPLHASALPNLMKCSWKVLMHFITQPDDETGEAGDTGSAIHKAVEAWHASKDIAHAIDHMREASSDFPRADLEEAAHLFFRYSQDPQNQEADVVATERQIRFEIDPAPEDPTQKKIQIVGTLDQVRRVDGQLRLFDIKSSKRPGFVLMMGHLYQVVAYSVGATLLFGEDVQPGAIIRVRAYNESQNSSPPGVFFNYTTTLLQSEHLFNGLRHIVAAVRAGHPIISPHVDLCTWCQAKSFDVCVPKLDELIQLNWKV